MDACLSQANSHGHVQMGRRGDNCGVMSIGQGRVQVGIVAVDLILLGNPRSQRHIDFANRRTDAFRTLKTPQMASSDRSHADNQDAFQSKHSDILTRSGVSPRQPAGSCSQKRQPCDCYVTLTARSSMATLIAESVPALAAFTQPDGAKTDLMLSRSALSSWGHHSHREMAHCDRQVQSPCNAGHISAVRPCPNYCLPPSLIHRLCYHE